MSRPPGTGSVLIDQPERLFDGALSGVDPVGRSAVPLPEPLRLAAAPRSWSRWKRPYQFTALGGDVIVAGCGATLALVLRTANATTFGLMGSIALVICLMVIWPAVLFLGRCYEGRYLGAGSEEFRRIFNAGVRVLAVIALTSFIFKLSLARSFVGISVPAVVLASLGWHALLRGWLNRSRRHGRGLHRVLVVGRWRAAERMVAALGTDAGEGVGLAVVGVCCDNPRGVTVGGREIPTVGDLTDVFTALERSGADTVAVASDSGLTPTQLRRLGWQLEGSSVDLVVGTDLVEVAGPRIHVRPVAGLPLLHVEQPELRGARRAVKSSYDRALALLALLTLAPLFAVVAVLIRLDSRGHAFYRQTRIGRHGKTFRIVKFRSMYADADARLADLAALNEHDGPLFKMRDDPRVSRVGRWLRRTSIDELPQLWNVLRGDMSLVGPRPPLPSEVEQYADDVRRRLLVKPGVTGLWQVSGRSNLSWEQCVRLDLSYVENWSPALDLMILLKTVKAVTARSGAY